MQLFRNVRSNQNKPLNKHGGETSPQTCSASFKKESLVNVPQLVRHRKKKPLKLPRKHAERKQKKKKTQADMWLSVRRSSPNFTLSSVCSAAPQPRSRLDVRRRRRARVDRTRLTRPRLVLRRTTENFPQTAINSNKKKGNLPVEADYPEVGCITGPRR